MWDGLQFVIKTEKKLPVDKLLTVRIPDYRQMVEFNQWRSNHKEWEMITQILNEKINETTIEQEKEEYKKTLNEHIQKFERMPIISKWHTVRMRVSGYMERDTIVMPAFQKETNLVQKLGYQI